MSVLCVKVWTHHGIKEFNLKYYVSNTLFGLNTKLLCLARSNPLLFLSVSETNGCEIAVVFVCYIRRNYLAPKVLNKSGLLVE